MVWFGVEGKGLRDWRNHSHDETVVREGGWHHVVVVISGRRSWVWGFGSRVNGSGLTV
jgi:hypothetical protein